MIMFTLSPSTSLSVTDSQNNTAPDRMKDNALNNNNNNNRGGIYILLLEGMKIFTLGLHWAATPASKQTCF